MNHKALSLRGYASTANAPTSLGDRSSLLAMKTMLNTYLEQTGAWLLHTVMEPTLCQSQPEELHWQSHVQTFHQRENIKITSFNRHYFPTLVPSHFLLGWVFISQYCGALEDELSGSPWLSLGCRGFRLCFPNYILKTNCLHCVVHVIRSGKYVQETARVAGVTMWALVPPWAGFLTQMQMNLNEYFRILNARHLPVNEHFDLVQAII